MKKSAKYKGYDLLTFRNSSPTGYCYGYNISKGGFIASELLTVKKKETAVKHAKALIDKITVEVKPVTTVTGLFMGVKNAESIAQLEAHLKRSELAYNLCSPSQMEMIDELIKRTKKNYEVKQ